MGIEFGVVDELQHGEEEEEVALEHQVRLDLVESAPIVCLQGLAQVTVEVVPIHRAVRKLLLQIEQSFLLDRLNRSLEYNLGGVFVKSLSDELAQVHLVILEHQVQRGHIVGQHRCKKMLLHCVLFN